jgi:hypothetical protein
MMDHILRIIVRGLVVEKGGGRLAVRLEPPLKLHLIGHKSRSVTFPNNTNAGDILGLTAAVIEEECKSRGVKYDWSFATDSTLVTVSLAHALSDVVHDRSRVAPLREAYICGGTPLYPDAAVALSRVFQAPLKAISVPSHSLARITDHLTNPGLKQLVVDHHGHATDIASFARVSRVKELSIDTWTEPGSAGPFVEMSHLRSLTIAFMTGDKTKIGSLAPFISACPNLAYIGLITIYWEGDRDAENVLLEQIACMPQMGALCINLCDEQRVLRALPSLMKMKSLRKLAIATDAVSSLAIQDLVLWSIPPLDTLVWLHSVDPDPIRQARVKWDYLMNLATTTMLGDLSRELAEYL